MVTVVDLLPPVITCPDDFDVDPEPNGTCTLEDFIASGQVDATDNCTDTVTGIIQSPAKGTLLGVGIHTVSFTVEDKQGTEGICTFELTVNQILGDADLSFNSLTMYPNPAATIFILAILT